MENRRKRDTCSELTHICDRAAKKPKITATSRPTPISIETESQNQDGNLLMLDAARNFSQQIAPLPALSYLHLSLARGHVSGAILSHLLGVCSTIQAIIIVLTSKFEYQKPCLPNCSCDEPQNWRTQNIPLVALEEVEI